MSYRPHQLAAAIMTAVSGRRGMAVEAVFWVEDARFRVDLKSGEQFEVLITKVSK